HATESQRPWRCLYVCWGNSCRSPAADAARRAALAEAGLADSVEVDSAGTGDWHIGEPPDPRMVAAAAEAGLTLRGRARLVTREDFETADLILVMDRANLADVRSLAPD